MIGIQELEYYNIFGKFDQNFTADHSKRIRRYFLEYMMLIESNANNGQLLLVPGKTLVYI